MFNWFKKNKSTKSEIKLIKDKLIPALNYTPVPFYHSNKFVADGIDVPKQAQDTVKSIPAADYLCDDMLDSSIDEDTAREKIYGNEQFVNHMNTIFQLLDSAEEAGVEAELVLDILTEDRTQIFEERNKFIEQYNSL